MPHAYRRSQAGSILAAILLLSPLACAAQGGAPGWDIEIDPTAYAMHGYSAPLGYLTGPLRIDLGAYGTDIPHWLHGNDGFHPRARGYGIKVQYFFSDVDQGWFGGAGISRDKTRIMADDSGPQANQSSNSVGAETGYRFALGHGFHLTAWGGFDYLLTARDVNLGARTYDHRHVQPFAALHLGYRF